jgi:hypothetical protein
MGKLQQSSVPLNEADGMRALLATCERDIASPTPANVRGLFEMLAAVEFTTAKLESFGTDLRPEASRLESLHDRIAHDATKMVKLLGGVGAYVAMRQSLQPATDGPAWQLDRMLAAQRTQRLRTFLVTCVTLAVLSGAFWWFRDTLLPPDPIGDIADAAQRTLLEGGSAQAALAQIDAGLTLSPTSPLLLTWRSVLLDDVDAGKSREAAAQAAAQIGERQFLLERATLNVQIDRPAAVIADANALIALDPQIPEAYYLRASGHELRNENSAAIADLEKCAALAEAQGNATLFANARIRLGNLMQRGG